MKKFIAILLALIISLSCFVIDISAQKSTSSGVVVNKGTENVSFDVAFPEIGKAITASVTGVDLAGISYKWFVNDCQINNFTDTYIPIADDAEKMLTVKVYDNNKLIGEKSVFISTLPVIYIETENRNSNIQKGNYMTADMTIQGNDEYNDSGVLYTGKTQIKGRGNSTWLADKKPYKIKLDSKADLFGMGKNKHWVLLSNPYDSSNMKNYLSYNFSNDIGLDASESVMVDLVLNGKSVGIYQLAEHTRIDETRVNITDWDDVAEDAAKAIYKKNQSNFVSDDKDALIDMMTEDLSWTTSDTVTYNNVSYTVSDYYDVPDITGGYLFETTIKTTGNQFTGAFGKTFEVDSPEGISEDMMNYIGGYYYAFEAALKSNDFCTVYNGKKMRYSDFIDIDSFAKGFLVNELFTNLDFGLKSTWFSKDIDGKLFYGPVWDMDYSTNNGFDTWTSTKALWAKRMMSDPVFMNTVRNLYLEYRYNIIQDLINDGGALDTAYEKFKTASLYNDKLWNMSVSYEDEVADLRMRLENKIAWLDTQFLTADVALSAVSANSYDTVANYYDTFSNSSDITMSLSNNTLNVTFAAAPAKADIYADGVLVNSIEKPAKTITENIEASGEYVVTVMAYDASNTPIKGKYIINQNPVQSLKITKQPDNINYSRGDTLDLTGLVLTATYKDGTTAVVKPDVAYTYAKDAVGTQCFAYNKVTDVSGSVYLVLSYECRRIELPLNVAPTEDYESVEKLIAKIPAKYNDDDFIKALFTAWTNYEDLSNTAKAKVNNYADLKAAINIIDNAASDESAMFLGSYVEDVFRENAKNNLILVMKNKDNLGVRSVVVYHTDGSTGTFSSSSKNFYSERKIGRYVIWSIGHVHNTSTQSYQIKVNYTGVPATSDDYKKTVTSDQFFCRGAKITGINYRDVLTEGDSVTFTPVCNSGVTDVKFTENGQLLSSISLSKTSAAKLKFETPGNHSVTVSCKTDGKWIEYKTLNLYVREKVIVFNNVINGNIIIGLKPGMKSLTGYFRGASEYSYECSQYGTDGVVVVYKNNNQIETYTLLLYGDLNGDGWYDGTDAVLVKCILSGEIAPEDISDAALLAADCNHDGVINISDVEKLEESGVFLEKINQTEDIETLENNSAYNEYVKLISQDEDENLEKPIIEPIRESFIQRVIKAIKSFFAKIADFFARIFG